MRRRRQNPIPTVTWIALGAAAVGTVLYFSMRKASAAPRLPAPAPAPQPAPSTSFQPTITASTPTPLSTPAPAPQFDPFDKLGPFKTGVTQDELDWLRSIGQ